MEPKSFIYGLVDPRTGQLRYVGQTSCGMRRPQQHAKPWSLKAAPHTHKSRWINSLVCDGLMYEIVILEVTEKLNEAERFWLAYLRSHHNLTNATVGGEIGMRGFKHSAEARQKMSAARIGGPGFRSNHSTTSRKKMSEAHQGKILSRTTRLKMSRARGGHPVVDNFGNRYDSAIDAVEKLGLDRGHIYKVLNGQRKSVKGYWFRYVEEQDNGG
jgi:group I intron endonuclease